MTYKIKPGENTRSNGGIYQEVDSYGQLKGNYATIRDNEKAPPTQQSSNLWVLIKRTPDSSR